VRRGWRVLAERWRSVGSGELDLVCLDPDGSLVGVEVRLRSSERLGHAADSISGRHRARLRAALVRFAVECRIPHAGLRLDLVTVTRAAPGSSRWRLSRYPTLDAW